MSKASWDIERVRQGIQRFFDEYGRYPKATEWDNVDYLPAARTIQRSFGGLETLRLRLGLEDVHFGKGKHRSDIAMSVNARGGQAEVLVKDLLVQRFGIEFVHEEKRIHQSSKNRMDFYVFCPVGNFGVDVFTTETKHSLTGNINHKLAIYGGTSEITYFVLVSDTLTLEVITEIVLNKTKQLPANLIVLNLAEFSKVISTKSRYIATPE